jgi:hypothetical protein
MKVEGESFFCGLTFPVGDAFCTLIVGGWDGDVIGISNIDGKPANTNSTTQFRAFETNRWYSIRLRITKERLEAYLDEEKVVDLATKGRNLEVWPQQEPTKPLGISTWRTTGAIRNIRMRPLAGQE